MVTISLRLANQLDESLLFDWVNDSEVRAQSFHSDSITQDEHAQWFSARLADPNCLIFIAEDETGQPVAQVRFDIDRQQSEALIDISLPNSCRGKGLSEIILTKTLQQYWLLEPETNLIAEVRDENLRSVKLFRKLQFVLAPPRRAGATVFELKFKL